MMDYNFLLQNLDRICVSTALLILVLNTFYFLSPKSFQLRDIAFDECLSSCAIAS